MDALSPERFGTEVWASVSPLPWNHCVHWHFIGSEALQQDTLCSFVLSDISHAV